MKKREKEKFQFGTDFQQEVLHYLIRDKNSIFIINKIRETYFTLIEHQIIFKCISSFYKKHKRVPGKVVLLESITEISKGREYRDLFTKEDFNNINSIIYKLYNDNLYDADVILDKINKFSTYIQVKHLQEGFDINDFNQYEEFHNSYSKILLQNLSEKKDKSHYLIKDVVRRQMKRQADPEVVPTPIRQLNILLNGGGFPMGSIVVLLDMAKAAKTATLVNISRLYLKRKKVVLFIDTENGASEIVLRLEQSILNKTKSEILSGEFDKKEQKLLRQYRRLKSEFIVRKVPANVSDANDIAHIIDEVEFETGLTVEVLVIDFMGKLASIGKHKDDNERISNVYIEIDNLAKEKGIEIVWSAQHVKREAEIRRSTRYLDGDIAKCIDIVRHAQAIIGLNSTDEERENKVQRLEIISMRDGPGFGRCMFNMDLSKQRMDEFTVSQRKEYDEVMAPDIDDLIKREGKTSSPRRGGKNPIADPDKANKKGGDS